MDSEEGKVFNIFIWPQIEITEDGVRGRRHRNGEKIAKLLSFEDAARMFPSIVSQLRLIPNKGSVGPMEMVWNNEMIKVKIRRVC